MGEMMKWLNEHPAFLMVDINSLLDVVNILHKKSLRRRNRLSRSYYISPIYFCTCLSSHGLRTRPKLTFRIVCLLFVSAISGYVDTYIIPFPLVGLQNTATTFIYAFVNMLETLNMRSMSGNTKVFLGTVIIVCDAMVLTLYKLTNFSDPGETMTIHHRTIKHINWLYPNKSN
ncbi:hypothetical protein MKW92_005622 [Papaver armeniacum]|nr:hypothetical protein MKW92_005622 [Papaver armeniacum]